MRHVLLAALAGVFIAGCRVGPKYERPKVQIPAQHRSAETPAASLSLGEKKWFDVFEDEALRKLITEALQANYDVKIAAQRILELQGRVTQTKSGLFPQLGAAGEVSKQNNPGSSFSRISGLGLLSWQIDFFGQVLSATDAARAELLATEENQKAVLQTIVASVANGYFELRSLDGQLVFAQESLKARTESLRLVTSRQQGGVASKLEVDQAQTLVATAAATIATLQSSIEQTENYLSWLLGRTPGPIERGRAFDAQPAPPAVPAGLPSALLERRPDIRFAEQKLVAANARIGVAKAAFFPSIALTGGGGYQSFDLTGVVTRKGGVSMWGASVDIPIFDAGARIGNYRATKAQKEQLALNYQQTVLNAFRDVSSALTGYQKAKEARAQKVLLADTLRDQSRLSTLRYRGGVTSYLEVLDTERQRLDAEQALADAYRAELSALVNLYIALGGGWQPV